MSPFLDEFIYLKFRWFVFLFFFRFLFVSNILWCGYSLKSIHTRTAIQRNYICFYIHVDMFLFWNTQTKSNRYRCSFFRSTTWFLPLALIWWIYFFFFSVSFTFWTNEKKARVKTETSRTLIDRLNLSESDCSTCQWIWTHTHMCSTIVFRIF